MNCPVCRKLLPYATKIITADTQSGGPQEGSFTICVGCASLLVFGPDALSLLLPSDADLDVMNQSPVLLLMITIAQNEIRNLVREQKRRQKASWN